MSRKKLINRIIKWGRGRDGLMYWLERELTPNFCRQEKEFSFASDHENNVGAEQVWEFSCNGYLKVIILCIFVSGSFKLRTGIKPEAHLDYISRHGDQDETKNCSVQDGCHMLPLWYVDVESRQQDCQNTGYNLHPSKSRPYGNKVENCFKRIINFMWRDIMASSESRAYRVLLKLKYFLQYSRCVCRLRHYYTAW